MGSLKEHDAHERALALAKQMAAEEAARAAAGKQAVDKLISEVSIDGKVSLPDALDVLSKVAPGQLDKSKASRLRKPIVDAVVGSDLLKGNALISGMPGGGHEKSIAAAIAGRYPNSKFLSVDELKARSPTFIFNEDTLIIYGFPTNPTEANAAAESVLDKKAKFDKSCTQLRHTTGRMVVLASGELDVSGITKGTELLQNFNLGRLTKDGVQKI